MSLAVCYLTPIDILTAIFRDLTFARLRGC